MLQESGEQEVFMVVVLVPAVRLMAVSLIQEKLPCVNGESSLQRLCLLVWKEPRLGLGNCNTIAKEIWGCGENIFLLEHQTANPGSGAMVYPVEL